MLKRTLLALVLFVLGSTPHRNASANEPAQMKTQTEVLAAILASLNLTNPVADLDANVSKGDLRFIGIDGYACHAPGVDSDADDHLITSAKYRLRCLPGTGDVLESEKHKALIDKALEYARKYNKALLGRIHAGSI
jgi:hypothetical protein